jgi:hypothetical protein
VRDELGYQDQVVTSVLRLEDSGLLDQDADPSGGALRTDLEHLAAP